MSLLKLSMTSVICDSISIWSYFSANKGWRLHTILHAILFNVV